MFKPPIAIYIRDNFVYHHLGCTSIYQPLSYPFWSMINLSVILLNQCFFFVKFKSVLKWEFYVHRWISDYMLSLNLKPYLRGRDTPIHPLTGVYYTPLNHLRWCQNPWQKSTSPRQSPNCVKIVLKIIHVT